MTFRVHLFAEQVFLSHVQSLTSTKTDDVHEEIRISCLSTLACAAALESTVNGLFLHHIKYERFDQLQIREKIEYILSTRKIDADWGKHPWQDVAKLVRLRNWLAHFKNSNIGLVNSDWEWIKDEVNDTPKYDPYRDLTLAASARIYKATLKALAELVLIAKGDLDGYEYLMDQEFQPILVG